MKLTTKQNDDLAVRKGKDKEGRFVELLTEMLGAMFALGMGAMDEWTYRQTLAGLQEQER